MAEFEHTANFEYTANPARIVFGAGTLSRLPAEVRALGGTRALLLGTSARSTDRAADVLGPLLVARFDRAAMHTPVEVTEAALELLRANGIDCLVAVGGGSAIGLAKALALRTDLPQVVLPTTYAGSEVTAVLGQTEQGRKSTLASPGVLPETVVYDVELTLGLPVALSVTSGVNAMAHAVEALYAPQANPVTERLAVESITLLARALPRIVADPADVEARADALQGAWLAGTCLGSVGMGLHHKLCHTLGGSFGLPHAETHTVVLPHAMAYNASAAPAAMCLVARALGVTDAPRGLYDLIVRLGGPISLRELGLGRGDLSRVVELATAAPYPNPRPVTAEGLAALLTDAWNGCAPTPSGPPDLNPLTEEVVASFANTPDPRTRELLGDLVRTLHGYVGRNDLTQPEWQRAVEFLARTGQISTPTRQEFVLLSDVLGVSSAVDILTNSRTPDTTPSAVLGPFYVDGPPETPHGADLAAGLPGTPMFADITVTDIDGAPVADAVVDVWQANEDGFYDVQLPDLDGPVLRARFHTNALGKLTFAAILPAEYPIPEDGPVGQLLAAVGRHPYRAPHVHFMIAKPGYRTLVTQLFVRGGRYLDSDTVFGVKTGLIVDFPAHQGPAPDGRPGPWRSLDFTFRIAAG
ncbi:maleylacetate reductase and hydroxyquinol 1,2-dioxygenase domain-containing protein [Crossiella cryophila]|uniref:Alcohol dehydrogenase class IV/protocatechuate 3,4-dioxygenase beta subunit n=1 Tax=Crossiella cryophila TaxID=43355 RepID=A0A7W7CFY4_9PSEU|nr:maleylacetate reductase and hydroxyquinol 1,2-dioxygenase domain-containing protein [Crossiella cryophila]MBB4680516.1 alcohol dehydrogenase class IV/protocatechuate 3,4-dioxygenase beta subunit [Crossiella cryophila]